MKLLSRLEELLLLAVWHLQDDAYTVTIQSHLQEAVGETWAFGALFVSLDRLVKKGYLDTYLADPTPERGGRSKRMYRLSDEGARALIQIRQIQESAWGSLTIARLRSALS